MFGIWHFSGKPQTIPTAHNIACKEKGGSWNAGATVHMYYVSRGPIPVRAKTSPVVLIGPTSTSLRQPNILDSKIRLQFRVFRSNHYKCPVTFCWTIIPVRVQIDENGILGYVLDDIRQLNACCGSTPDHFDLFFSFSTSVAQWKIHSIATDNNKYSVTKEITDLGFCEGFLTKINRATGLFITS